MGPSKNMHLTAYVATILLASGILSSNQQRALYFAMATHHDISSSEHSITPYHDAPSSLRRRREGRGKILQELHTMKNTHEEQPISHFDEQGRKLHAVGVIHEHNDDEQGTTFTNNNVDERWDDYQPFTSTSDVTNFLQSTAIKISEHDQDQEEGVVRPEYTNVTDTSLFDTNQIINNPLQSNRNEILTKTSQQQKPKSQMIPTMSPAPSLPTVSPVPTSSTSSAEPGIIIHDGPHFSDEDTYNYNDNDDPPSGHGYYGSRDENGNYIREETDFKEFIAFVGWYAFLIICCLLPTFCAYYRRRRNARVLRENLTNIQTRLAEIEQRRNENDTTIHLELEGENRDRDWEYLESLFGSSSPPPSSNNTSEEEEESRRRIMSDIMGSVGIRVLDLMERDVRRRKEKGRKVVGALKQTSLLVKECHLVDNRMKNKKKEGATTAHDNDGDDNIVLATGGLNDSIVVDEGDIELGNMNCNRSPNEDKPINGLEKESEDDQGMQQEVYEHKDLTSNMMNDVLTTPAECKEQTTSIEDSDKADSGDNVMPTPSAPPPPPLTTKSEMNNNNDDSQAISTPAVDDDTTAVAAPQSVDAAIPAITPPRDNSISSLYQVDDPYVDDDDDEGNTVLCIPCTNNNVSDESSKTVATITQPRCVPATCIICLLQYEPGTYVTWSSNKECTHAFHRDCILMWLLKKDEPYLCPCCRREFVLESMLNNDDNNEEERRGGGGTGDSGGGAGVIVMEHNSRRESVQQRDDNGPLPDTTVAAPAWNSLSNAARPL